jgi:hypothetical protein
MPCIKCCSDRGSPYGNFVDATIRHRVDKDSGENTSYALVTMADEEAMQAVLAAEVMAGDRLLNINPYTAKTAENSAGAMARTRTGNLQMQQRMKEAEEEANLDEFAAQHHDKYGTTFKVPLHAWHVMPKLDLTGVGCGLTAQGS